MLRMKSHEIGRFDKSISHPRANMLQWREFHPGITHPRSFDVIQEYGS